MKKLRTILAVFIVILITGIAYAAVSGDLLFGGTATFADQVELQINVGTITPSGNSSAATGRAGVMEDPGGGPVFTTKSAVSGTGNIELLLEVNFTEPGDIVTFNFTIQNIGLADAKLGAIPTTINGGIDIDGTGAVGFATGDVTVATNYGAQVGADKVLTAPVSAGTTTASFNIVVTWVSGDFTDVDTVLFTITIPYTKA